MLRSQAACPTFAATANLMEVELTVCGTMVINQLPLSNGWGPSGDFDMCQYHDPSQCCRKEPLHDVPMIWSHFRYVNSLNYLIAALFLTAVASLSIALRR